jgi:hypothetical protein
LQKLSSVILRGFVSGGDLMYGSLEERLGVRIARGGESGGGGGPGYNSEKGTLGAAIGGALGRVGGSLGGLAGSLAGRAIGGYGDQVAHDFRSAGRNVSNTASNGYQSAHDGLMGGGYGRGGNTRRW